MQTKIALYMGLVCGNCVVLAIISMTFVAPNVMRHSNKTMSQDEDAKLIKTEYDWKKRMSVFERNTNDKDVSLYYRVDIESEKQRSIQGVIV